MLNSLEVEKRMYLAHCKQRFKERHNIILTDKLLKQISKTIKYNKAVSLEGDERFVIKGKTREGWLLKE